MINSLGDFENWGFLVEAVVKMLFIKIVCFFILLQTVKSSVLSSTHDGKDNLVLAVHQIISRSFIGKFSVINLIKTAKNDDFLEELLTKGLRNFAIYLQNHESIQSLRSRKRENSIVILNDARSCDNFIKNINPDMFSYRGLFLFVFVNGEIEGIDETFAVLWQKNIYNINVIYEKGRFVEMKTFLPFNGTKCGDSTPKLVGKFDQGNFTGNIESIFPTKFKNLHNCPIRVATYEEPLSVIRTKNSDDNYSLSGIDVGLLSELANILNFNKQISLLNVVEPWGVIYLNGTVTGAFGDLVNGKADIVMGSMFLQTARLVLAASSVPYHNIPVVFVIFGNQKPSIFEKLSKPLDNFVWIGIILTLGFGAFFALLIDWKFKAVKKLFFGAEIHHPITDMIMIVLGISQPKLPKQNFSRFILTILLVNFMVLRSAYQGKLYDFLQTNDNSKGTETINELIEQNYEFVLFESVEVNFSNAKPIK